VGAWALVADDVAAKLHAMEEAKVKAAAINAIVDAIEEEENSPGMVVKDLVSSFLFPQVHGELLKQSVLSDQKKLLLAAHSTVVDSVRGDGFQHSPIPK
jgi:hypothetical protein